MTTRLAEAWILHKQWSGETSVRVSFFTREMGVIQCLYKGGRTPKRQAFLQAFTPLWIRLVVRYDRYYIQQIESISPTLELTGNALFSSLYLNEILYYALSPHDSDERLFNAYLFTLNNLVLTKEQFDVEALLRRFEWTLLQACGYSFSLTQEAKTAQLIESDLYYQFVADKGFLFDSTGKGIPGAHILALAQDNLSDAAYLKSAKLIMRQAIDHLVGGRKIKARSLYFKDLKSDSNLV